MKPNIRKKRGFKDIKKFICLALVIALSFPLVLPLLQKGFFPTHDGEWAVIRLGAMHRAFMSGDFPVRWSGNLNFSYGYPLFQFTYPLPYYLGELFYLLGFGLVGSIKALFVMSVFFSGIMMFFLAREFFGNLGGMISAVFYLYAPFRLVNLYVRGSLGESLAFALFPALLFVLRKINFALNRWLGFGAILVAALLLTHNISALIFMPFFVAFAFFLMVGKQKSKDLCLGKNALVMMFLGFGLSAFFLLPALVEKKYVAIELIPLTNVTEHFVSLKKLILPSWGFGPPNSLDAFSFQLGWVHLLAFAVGLFVCGFSANIYSFSFICLVLLMWLMLPISSIFWKKMPFFSQVDFPWRVLGTATFFLSLGTGCLAKAKKMRYLGLLLVIMAVFFNYRYVRPSNTFDRGDDYYFTNEGTTTSHDELMPVWVEQKPVQRPAQRVELVQGKVSINNVFTNPNNTKISASLVAKSPSTIRINAIYFPGWEVKLNNKPQVFSYRNKQGLIELQIPNGEQRLEARFKETRFRLVADLISGLSVILVCLLLLRSTGGTKS